MTLVILLKEKGHINEAFNLCLEKKEAGHMKSWLSVLAREKAKIYEKNGEPIEAAKIYEKAGMHDKAAEIYEELKNSENTSREEDNKAPRGGPDTMEN